MIAGKHLDTIVKTLLSKIFVLALNFIVVIITTNLWGAEGRGDISILIADIAIITIINNILGGTSVSYFIPRTGFSKLIIPAYLWILVSTSCGAFVFSIILGHQNFFSLFLLTLLGSLANVHLSAFIGKEEIKWFNLLSLLQPIILITFMFLIYFTSINSVYVFYWAYGISQTFIFLFSLFIVKGFLIRNEFSFQWQVVKQSFLYGIKNETSYFLQFLSYRLSLYFVLYYLGQKEVGLLSVGIALGESVWVISKSISMVQYSKLINMSDSAGAVEFSKKLLIVSLIGTSAAITVLLIIPASWYGVIFGEEFTEIKYLFMILIPGILSIAVSNIPGHYFSAKGIQNILIIKSLIGLVATLVFSVLLIPKLGLPGACITSSAAYLLPSVYLIFVFYKSIRRN